MIYFLSMVLLFSCKSIKIKDIDMDSTQKLFGKIKQIKINHIDYLFNKNNTKVNEENSIVYFGLKNKIVKQIDYFPKFSIVTIFSYKNELIENELKIFKKRNLKNEYIYDIKKNVVAYNQLENDILNFSKTYIYDKKNNPLEVDYLHPKHKSNNSISKYCYDYEKKICNDSFF